MATPSRTSQSWLSAAPLTLMCCLGLLLFLISSTIVLALIPIYLPTRGISGVVSTTSELQTIALELSPNSGTVPVGSILDTQNQIAVQNQMQAVIAADTTTNRASTVSVVNATGTTSSRRKRQETNLQASRLSVIYQLIFYRTCTSKKCQTEILDSTRTKFALLKIGLVSTTAATTTASTVLDNESTSDIDSISEYWANLRPYKDNTLSFFGVTDTGLPDGCQVEQAHILHRHGSRYPLNQPIDGGNINQFAIKIKQIVSAATGTFTGPLYFLNTWSLQLGLEYLVPSGAAIEYQSGVDFWNDYGRILYNAQPGQTYYSGNDSEKLLFRTTSEERNYQSALDWASGFFGPYNTTNKYSLLVIPSTVGTNNTLSGYLNCINSLLTILSLTSPSGLLGYAENFLSSAKTRLSVYASPNVNLTEFDVYAMQSLCAYEYSAFGSSDFCSLFTINEWRGFEQLFNIGYYTTFSFGSATGRAQGLGYVEELIARLTNKYISVSDSSVNSTLDSSAKTFPLNQTFYMDMSHDNNMASVLTALSSDYFRENISYAFPPPSDQHFRLSFLVPFGARLITEKIGCTSSSPVSTNSSRTQYSSSQYGYAAELATYKFIRMRLNNGILPLNTIRGDLCSVGRSDGLCPLDNFINSQANASVQANFKYVCYAKYTANSSKFTGDGTIFA